MREIEFRAWDKVGAWMVGDATVKDRLNSFPKTWELMQYTGLKDTIGAKIYEGDRIIHHSRNSEFPHPVIFDQDQAAWCGDYGLKYPLTKAELEEVVVVGNIYEDASRD